MIALHLASAGANRRGRTASVLITALLIATALGLGLVGYLSVARNAMKLSQRTFFVEFATNLAEAGMEEAVYTFRLMDSGIAVNTAWSSWTLSGANAKLTLPSFDCGQQAIGIVKVYVTGYNGSSATPSVIVQATITPFGESNVIRKTLKASLKKKGAYNAAIITSTSLSLGASTQVDSFNSLSSSNTRVAYPGDGATKYGHLVAYGGTISLGSNSLVKGNVYLGSTVSAPSASQVDGEIVPDYVGSFPTPAWPSVPSTPTGYYGLLSFPATLPRSGDVTAADGRYYYYPMFLINPTTLGATTITAGKNVTIMATSMSSGLTLGSGATCIVWTGNISTSGSPGLTNPNWAGALQIYSWGTSISLGHGNSTSACIYAPLASVTLNGGGSIPDFTGSIIGKSFSCTGQWQIHYDESLKNISTQVGTGWAVGTWYDLQGTAELGTLYSTTGGFLN